MYFIVLFVFLFELSSVVCYYKSSLTCMSLVGLLAELNDTVIVTQLQAVYIHINE